MCTSYCVRVLTSACGSVRVRRVGLLPSLHLFCHLRRPALRHPNRAEHDNDVLYGLLSHLLHHRRSQIRNDLGALGEEAHRVHLFRGFWERGEGDEGQRSGPRER